MALYFFHIQTDTRSTDEVGMEFARPQEARGQVIVTCGEMVKDDPDNF